MFAVAEFKGKQVKVEENKDYKIPYFSCKAGDKLTADKVMFVFDDKQALTEAKDLEKATVEAEVIEAGQTKKISVVKFHSKKRYQRLGNHRQDFIKVKINKISV